MDLRSGCPFWVLQAGEQAAWPDLEGDARAEVVVIGGGITGALAAWRLAREGFDTLLLDRREAGLGSTAASTALLQYELDTPLSELRDLVGREAADRAYRRCVGAFDELEEVLDLLGERAGYARRQSLYLATESSELAALRREYEARAGLGIEVELLDRRDLLQRFGIDRPGAILSALGGELDAYTLTLRLLESAAAHGARIRTGERSEVVAVEAGAELVLRTAGHATLRARSLVFATGYEFAPALPAPKVNLASTYALATAPTGRDPPWPGRAIIWETARPYLYFRTLADGRIIVGGADEPVADPARRDARIEDKARALIASARRVFPELELTADCAWAGVFAGTPDGMPYIGRVPGLPGAFASLAYGGNGITFGVLASGILLDLCRGTPHPDAELFGLDRPVP
ncbi:MAG TPA: FAD-dependent oxidoreductase [Gemmatimonadales bacterium]